MGGLQEERLQHHNHEEANVLSLLQAQRIMEPPAHPRRGGPSTGRRLIVTEPAARRRRRRRVESEAISRAGIREHLCLSSERQQQISTRKNRSSSIFLSGGSKPPPRAAARPDLLQVIFGFRSPNHQSASCQHRGGEAAEKDRRFRGAFSSETW